MKTLNLLVIILISANTVYADVLEKIKFEDAAQSRLQKGLQDLDQHIEVNIYVGYRKTETLPGIITEDTEELAPSKIDERDIAKIYIDVNTSLNPVPSELKNRIYKLLPINKNRISIKFKHVPYQQPTVQEPIKPQDLMQIKDSFVEQLKSNTINFLAIVGTVVLMLVLLVQQRNLNVFKVQFEKLIAAISEGTHQANKTLAPPATTVSSSDNFKYTDSYRSLFKDLSNESLKQLMSDCYWSQKDNYAHWIWKQMSLEQKKYLLNDLNYIKDYSEFFVNLAPVDLGFHEHPYYLNPLATENISQDDLSRILESQPTLWNQISPLRQQDLKIPISKRLEIVTNKNKPQKLSLPQKQSLLRTFETTISLGPLSIEDETQILADPQIVPVEWRKNTPSLVWLCLRDDKYIKSTLERYDARALASAWVGAPLVLEKLEKQIPDKKLKLILIYRNQITPTKSSPCYQALFHAGLFDDAA